VAGHVRVRGAARRGRARGPVALAARDSLAGGRLPSRPGERGRRPRRAVDAGVARPGDYDYFHEGITVLAARAPKLESVLLVAKRPCVLVYPGLGRAVKVPTKQ
jgi:hypothetical protein